MKKSSDLLIILGTIVFIAGDIGLDFFLENSSQESRVWFAITILIIFAVIAFQRTINTSQKANTYETNK